jgi:hypothetical protein
VWVLIIVAVLNGKVHLDALPMPDKWTCQQQGREAVEAAKRANIEISTRCKELKIG